MLSGTCLNAAWDLPHRELPQRYQLASLLSGTCLNTANDLPRFCQGPASTLPGPAPNSSLLSETFLNAVWDLPHRELPQRYQLASLLSRTCLNTANDLPRFCQGPASTLPGTCPNLPHCSLRHSSMLRGTCLTGNCLNAIWELPQCCLEFLMALYAAFIISWDYPYPNIQVAQILMPVNLYT